MQFALLNLPGTNNQVSTEFVLSMLDNNIQRHIYSLTPSRLDNNFQYCMLL
jgi:hypothetical protein